MPSINYPMSMSDIYRCDALWKRGSGQHAEFVICGGVIVRSCWFMDGFFCTDTNVDLYVIVRLDLVQNNKCRN